MALIPFEFTHEGLQVINTFWYIPGATLQAPPVPPRPPWGCGAFLGKDQNVQVDWQILVMDSLRPFFCRSNWVLLTGGVHPSYALDLTSHRVSCLSVLLVWSLIFVRGFPSLVHEDQWSHSCIPPFLVGPIVVYYPFGTNFFFGFLMQKKSHSHVLLGRSWWSYKYIYPLKFSIPQSLIPVHHLTCYLY